MGCSNPAGLAFYTWLTLTSFVGSGFLLCLGKVCESSIEDQKQLRRLWMSGLGLVVGVLSVSLAGYFQIDLGFERLLDFSLVNFELLRLPKAIEWTLFFVALFSTIEWWKLCDPLRRSKISIWNVGICFVVAATAATILGLPLIPACVVSFVLAVATQLSAPWLNQQKRESISPPKGGG